MSEPEWPVAFFDDDYLKFYGPLLTEERTRAEVEFITSVLDVPSGSRVLDLACGAGRHAIAMAKRGFEVTGVDFNAHYLEIAAREAARAGAGAEWVQADMRTLDFEGEFEGAYSWFTSFGYFSDAENEQVAANVARSLVPGGRFLIDMMNRDWLLTHPQQRTWHQREDGALLVEELELELATSRVTSRQTLIGQDGGSRITKAYDLRAYTCAELSAMFERHGLSTLGRWGALDRTPYSQDTRRLILLAERRRTRGRA